MFYFHEFLERIDVDPTKTKLLRHNPSDFTYWIGRELEKFGCYASFQKKSPSPYQRTLWKPKLQRSEGVPLLYQHL